MNRNFRRAMSVIVLAVMVLSLSACGKDEKVNEQILSSEINDAQEQINDIVEDSANVDVGEYVMASEDAFTWEEADGGVAIVGYSGEETTIEIPSQIAGKDVVDIKSGTFADVAVVGVKLPDTMTKIGESAFYYCTSLVEIIFGENVKNTSLDSFAGCIALKSVKFNEGFAKIGDASFTNTTSLETLNLPSSLMEIGDGAFCLSGLKTITIPGNVSRIGVQTFASCKSLTEVIIEDGVNKIGKKAYESCSSLSKVQIPESVTAIDFGAFIQCASDLTISAPIGSAAEKYAKEEELLFEAL